MCRRDDDVMMSLCNVVGFDSFARMVVDVVVKSHECCWLNGLKMELLEWHRRWIVYFVIDLLIEIRPSFNRRWISTFEDGGFFITSTLKLILKL